MAVVELNETEYYEKLRSIRERQDKEIYNYITMVENQEKKKKQQIAECEDQDRRALLMREYSTFNARIQADLKRIMGSHKMELDEFVFRHHF